MISEEIIFTGERIIPKMVTDEAMYFEHIIRYMFASTIVKNKDVLDAGCGVGYGSHILSQIGNSKSVLGFDISSQAISYAEKHYRNKKTTFSVVNVQELSKHLENKKVDVVTAFELIEHLERPDVFLQEVKEVLNKDGVFVVSTPNKALYPSGNPFHVKEYSYDEFVALLRKFFPIVNVYVQNFTLQSSIGSSKGISSSKIVNFFGKKITCEFCTQSGVKINAQQSDFFVAICSFKTLPRMDNAAWNTRYIKGLDLRLGLAAYFLALSNQISQDTDTKRSTNLKVYSENFEEKYSKLIKDYKKSIIVTKQKVSEIIKIKKTYKKLESWALHLQGSYSQVESSYIQILKEMKQIENMRWYKLWGVYKKMINRLFY